MQGVKGEERIGRQGEGRGREWRGPPRVSLNFPWSIIGAVWHPDCGYSRSSGRTDRRVHWPHIMPASSVYLHLWPMRCHVLASRLAWRVAVEMFYLLNGRSVPPLRAFTASCSDFHSLLTKN